MKFLMKMFGITGFAVLIHCSTAWAGAPDKALPGITKAGKIVIALDPTYPPMESEESDGKLVGFDIDMAREIAKRLGVKAEFMVMAWEGIISGLVSNRYDLIISSMNITAEREKQINFVPYAKMSELFVTKIGADVHDEAGLAGKVLAVAADTTSYDYAQKQKAKGLAIKEIKAFRLMSDAFMAVKTGHADVLIVDEPVARYFTKLDKNTFHITGRAMAPEAVGIGVRRAATDLHEAVAKAIEAMRKDGTLKALQDTWFGGELGV